MTANDDGSLEKRQMPFAHEQKAANRTLAWRMRRYAYRYAVYYPTVLARGQPVQHYLDALLRTQHAKSADLIRIQDRQLRALGSWVTEHVPHYAGLANLTLSRENLRDAPILDKSIIVHRQSELRACARLRRFKKTTGGSTGQPVTIDKDAQALAWELAAAWRGYSWAGVSIGDPQGRLWGTPITSAGRRTANITDLLLHRRRCSAFPFTAEDMDHFTKTLNRFQPAYLYGYVSMLVEYAQHLLNSSKRLDVNLVSVITTSEVLDPSHRKLLNEVFNCSVFDEYGCGEVGTIAHECAAGSLHINSENVLLEVLQADGQASFVGEGELLVTDLKNRAMPLIRYRIGDAGVLSDAPCRCGSGLQILSKVFGRAYDMITNLNGQRFHGEFFMYMVEESKRRRLGVDGFQVVQTGPNELLLKLVPGSGFSNETERFIGSYLKERFHPEVQVTLSLVERIERERSGKMRVVVAQKQQ